MYYICILFDLLCIGFFEVFTLRIAQFVDERTLNEEEISRVIEMAWEDRTPFEAIELNYGLSESRVIKLMRSQLKPKSFKVWRERVTGRKTKHEAFRTKEITRGYCPTQYKHRRR